MMNSRERRLSSWSNATCAMPLCEALSSRRGRRAHHAQKDRVGTWEIPRLAVSWSAGGPHREGEEPKPMMHGRGKSDPAIVAGKPANKVEPSTAEPVEPRAGTEGNAGQQSACRTQSRAGASQALERIRQTFAVWTRGRSRMRESCMYGSGRGARGNSRPYRDRRDFVMLLATASLARPYIARAQQS